MHWTRDDLSEYNASKILQLRRNDCHAEDSGQGCGFPMQEKNIPGIANQKSWYTVLCGEVVSKRSCVGRYSRNRGFAFRLLPLLL